MKAIGFLASIYTGIINYESNTIIKCGRRISSGLQKSRCILETSRDPTLRPLRQDLSRSRSLSLSLNISLSTNLDARAQDCGLENSLDPKNDAFNAKNI